MYILDTSFIIALLRGKPKSRQLLEGITSSVSTSVVCLGELAAGLARQKKQNSKEKTSLAQLISQLDGIIVINEDIALHYGKIKADLSARGELIGDNDTWIAASCLHHDATLITLNSKHFRRVKSLKLA